MRVIEGHIFLYTLCILIRTCGRVVNQNFSIRKTFRRLIISYKFVEIGLKVLKINLIFRLVFKVNQFKCKCVVDL